MLQKDTFANEFYNFIFKQQKTVQENVEDAIRIYTSTLEKLVDERIKSIDLTLTIPVGAIKVAGSPTAQQNVTPLVIHFSGSSLEIS